MTIQLYLATSTLMNRCVAENGSDAVNVQFEGTISATGK